MLPGPDLTAEAFFGPAAAHPSWFSRLFAPDRPVWEGLCHLKTFFSETAGDLRLPAELAAAQGGPLSETWVLHYPGLALEGTADSPSPNNAAGPQPRAATAGDFPTPELIAGRECRIVFEAATKGKLAVYHQGRRLPGASVLMAGAVLQGRQIAIGPGVLVESGAFLKEPLLVGAQSEIRQGAYLRGHCLIGRRCVVGHVTEIKHSIMLDEAKAGHFAYLGDSILGPEVNLGAGTKLANLRFTGGNVQIRYQGGSLDSGLKKLGAILGSRCQTGCNTVTNPGTLLGKGCLVLPNTTAPSGYHTGNTIIRG